MIAEIHSYALTLYRIKETSVQHHIATFRSQGRSSTIQPVNWEVSSGAFVSGLCWHLVSQGLLVLNGFGSQVRLLGAQRLIQEPRFLAPVPSLPPSEKGGGTNKQKRQENN